jgi:hypothetical protein
MDQQGFDPMEQPLFSVIDFMERLKSVEEPFKKPKSKDKDKKKSNSSSGNKKKPTFFCSEHGLNFTHDTKDCKVLANKKLGSYSGKKKPFGNKTCKGRREQRDHQEGACSSCPEGSQEGVQEAVQGTSFHLQEAQEHNSSSDEDNDNKECFLLLHYAIS